MVSEDLTVAGTGLAHGTSRIIFLSLPRMTAADFLEVKTCHAVFCLTIHPVVPWWVGSQSLSLGPLSQCIMVTRIWLLSPLTVPNPTHQHTITFSSSGKHHWVRLRPNLCNCLKEIEIFWRCWMGSVWPLSLELWSLSLFQMERVLLTAHNCWPSSKLRDIWPLKNHGRTAADDRSFSVGPSCPRVIG